MGFSLPCELGRMDMVLDLKGGDSVFYAKGNDGDVMLSAEGDNGYTYVFIGLTEESLINSINKMEFGNDYTVQTITLYELLDNWRAVVLDGELTLLMGCSNHSATTALCNPGGPAYPHVYQLITYVQTPDGPVTNDSGMLICAGNNARLLWDMFNHDHNFLSKFYTDKVWFETKPLLHVAKQHSRVMLEKSLVSLGLAVAHSYHSQTMEKDNNV